jgi:integrase
MTLLATLMTKTKRAKQWPRIYIAKHRSGQASFQVDLRAVNGGRPNFATRAEAQAYAELSRIKRDNEGQAAFTLPQDVALDASKAHVILKPHDVSILEAAKYYEKHVLAYKKAPIVKDLVERYLADSINRGLRPRSIGDLRHRLNSFAIDFGDSRLSDITLDEVKEWIQDDQWEMRTRINYLTKISQLYGYAIRHKWADSNLTEHIDRPAVDETTPEIFTVEQTGQLLAHAHECNLLPYIAIGLFAGVRSAEMMRLDSKNINFEGQTLTIGADIAKKRSQRIIDMQPTLLAWLEPVKDKLKAGGLIADANGFRKNKARLLEAAQISDWPANGLRHSFGSYHYAMFRNADDTSHQMGNSVDIVHKHYKTLVPRSEAEEFWNLRPQPIQAEIAVD